MNMNRKEFVAGTLAVLAMGCAGKEETSAMAIADTKGDKKMKTLVAYFSATGNTRAKARLVADATGGTLYEIVPEKAYTEADLDWRDKKSRSSVEMADKSSRPAVKGKVENMADFDVVYLGFPIWWYVAPTIVNTFLEAHDLKGKKIVPFFTSGGSGAGKTLDYLRPSAKEATFATPKNLTRATAGDVAEWVKSL